jgi:N6-adenosine-specific RNA methylase IME4
MNELAPFDDELPALHAKAMTPTSRASLIDQTHKTLAVLEAARDPADVIGAERLLESFENLMRQTGLFSAEEIRLANEGKLRARWKLGRLLAREARGGGRGKVSTGLKLLFERLHLTAQTAMQAQRIGTLPEAKLVTALAAYRGGSDFATFSELIRIARPYWHRERRNERLEEIGAAAALETLGMRYPIILADPPWRYENPPMGGGNRSIENHYPTMALAEICGLPIEDIAATDCTLYLWATAPKLAECFKVLEAWGFSYRTNFVWVKDKIGMGYHARSQHELLLVAKRGDLPPPEAEARVSSVIVAPRGRHSAKPERVYELIESFYPTLKKIELFARAGREGWASWGNQSEAA